ncbi:beta-lactamase/transpeptidase-like protein [Zopfia rhizophila CBS 207.26]|uniref:Beta-lactamase/transpeptidase-like protein n=1 Tax=Zopfia rhizophila CBS 207.26 TaxID=1314779 RepID=A0A6A6DLK9_9PEZI|nr:beta-lactamase/transpeptidase-like protein [Zopfia rhizophila CBS 207.26]
MRLHKLLLVGILPSAFAYCPPPGPLLPPPDFHANSVLNPDQTDAIKQLNASFSIRGSIGGEPAFEFDYTAASHNVTITGNTMYRIASVTKVFTVLAVLLQKEKMRMDDPIGKFVPELKGGMWDDVTVGALCSQTAGLPKDLLNNTFVYPVNSRPAYSSPAYIILGFALENATGKPYNDVIRDLIIKPLGLNLTGFDTPTPDKDIALLGDPWSARDFGTYNATAGLWSTPNSLLAFLNSILQSKLLSPAQTRAWLKPHTFTSTLTQAVGAPWEIMRPANLNLTYPRPIDLYTKMGSVPTYAAHAVLIPEYDLAISIMAAGSNSNEAVAKLIGMGVENLVPIADQLARQQAADKYVGTYVSTNLTNNASLTIALDDGPGLAIPEWKNQGKDMLDTFSQIASVERENFGFRLYTMGLGDRWRVGFESVKNGASFADMGCDSWLLVDSYRYGKQPLDELEFRVKGGKVEGVWAPGLRLYLKKETRYGRI